MVIRSDGFPLAHSFISSWSPTTRFHLSNAPASASSTDLPPRWGSAIRWRFRVVVATTRRSSLKKATSIAKRIPMCAPSECRAQHGAFVALLAEQAPRLRHERRGDLGARKYLAVTQQPSHVIRPCNARALSRTVTLPNRRPPVARAPRLGTTTLSRLCPSELLSASCGRRRRPTTARSRTAAAVRHSELPVRSQAAELGRQHAPRGVGDDPVDTDVHR